MDVITPASNDMWLQPPKEPKWQWTASSVDIELVDKSSNKNVIIKSLLNFFTTLRIVGVSEGMITRLVENGFNTIAKICNMSVVDFLTLPGVKEKMANKLYTNIHSIIDKPIAVETLMTATNIFKGGLGEKKIVVVVRDYPKLMEQIVKVEDVMKCEGFSTKTANAFIAGLEKFKEFIKKHTFLKYTIKFKKTTQSKDGKMKAEFIVMTGFRDKDLEDKLVGMGATIQSGINSKTTLVIAKDVEKIKNIFNRLI